MLRFLFPLSPSVRKIVEFVGEIWNERRLM